MTQELSSLMDGELAADEAQRAITACCASEESKVDWHLYHVIGDVMRGHSPRSLELPKGVVEALKAQPTVLAPRRIPQGTLARVAFAAAASVATIGVVGWIGSRELARGHGRGGAIQPGDQPVANTVTLPLGTQPLEVRRTSTPIASCPPEMYRPVNNNRAPAAAAR
jgi:negative regulator of sigma E activity